jgi:hypothetical protein
VVFGEVAAGYLKELVGISIGCMEQITAARREIGEMGVSLPCRITQIGGRWTFSPGHLLAGRSSNVEEGNYKIPLAALNSKSFFNGANCVILKAGR